jgi:hypothetical protein
MANRNSGHRPAGGLHSRQVVHSKAPKVEPRARQVREQAVGQIGTMMLSARPTWLCLVPALVVKS